MKIYLNGVEYKAYRNILKSLGVRFGCLNYEYIWARTPRFNLEEECDFLDEIIVDPGFLKPDLVYDYIEFLNTHSNYFTFAIELYTKDRIMLKEPCAAEIIPWYNDVCSYPSVAVSVSSLAKPFIKTKLLRLKEKGINIHGVNCELSFFDSMSSGTWMRGKAGWISHFDRNNHMRLHREKFTASAFARELIEEGYSLNLDEIKRGSWKEIAKINCIAWKKFQDWMEVR